MKRKSDPACTGGEEKLAQPVAISGETLTPIPIPKIDLHDAHAIRRELASVYRDMRAGRIEAQDGTRHAYVLDLIRKGYETSILQDRLELLERTLAHRSGKK